jgi:hypothetical protein
MSRYLIGSSALISVTGLIPPWATSIPPVLPTDPAASPRDPGRLGTRSTVGFSISSLADWLPPNRLRDGTVPLSIQFEPPLFRSDRAVALCRPPWFACE